MSSHRHGSIVAGVLCGTLVLTIAPAQANHDPKPEATEKASPTAATDSDAAILSKLVTVDQNEIKMARAAEHKKVSAATMNYARMLHDQHQKNLSETQKLAHSL